MLANAGFNLALAGRRAEALEQTREMVAETADAACIITDIAEPEQATAMVASAFDRFGRLDVLVNNAAAAPLLPIDQHTPAIVEQTFFTNAIGPACAIASAWRIFKSQHAAKSNHPLGPCIINVSTLGTRDPFPGFFAYASSKAALNLMVRSAAAEGREYNIRAFAIAPGAVETAMLRSLFDKKTLPTEQCLTPERVAEEIVACIMGERPELNGQTIYMSAAAGVFTG